MSGKYKGVSIAILALLLSGANGQASRPLRQVAGTVKSEDTAPEKPSGWIDKNSVHSEHFSVAAANPLAVDAGYEVIKVHHGTAIDAAIATQLVLNLVEPQSSGIGGGAFILYHDSETKKLKVFDGRETAPAAANPGRFMKNGEPLERYDAIVGGKSVGVPGTLRVLKLAHKRYGKLKWAKLFEPAIRWAENGFPVSPRLNSALSSDKYLTLNANAKAYFFGDDGKPRPVGHILKNPEFAKVLKRIADEGPDAFYKGEIAKDIVTAVKGHPTNPGDITEADLAGYRAQEREPICGQYREYKVCGLPAPSSGGVAVLQILGMIERFPLPTYSPNSIEAVHIISEADRLAYADRDRYLADPDFVKQPQWLTDRAYLAERSQLIKEYESMGTAQPGNPPAGKPQKTYGSGKALDLPSTSHIAIVDEYGNALSMTTTIEDGFGSRIMTHGFLLNNELTDFSFEPFKNDLPVANRIEKNKRPRSSMAPTIIYDKEGRIKMITGSPGGSAIINYVVKSIVGVLDWSLDPQIAVDLPNFGSRNEGVTELEKGTPIVALEPKLKAMHHVVRIVDFNSGLQAIVRTKEGWVGGADGRREGKVRGD